MLTKALVKSNAVVMHTAKRSFASSVTYELKDLIRDPEQQGKPLYYTHRLDENILPKTVTTTKTELLGYLHNMIVMRRTELESDRLYKA